MKRNLNEMKAGRMLAVGLLCGAILLTGCGKDVSADEFMINNSESPTETEANTKDDEPLAEPIDLGSLGHGFVKKGSLVYKGGALEIPYTMNGSGIGTKGGFLVYVNGIPQPYMIKDTQEEYKYMHTVESKENQELAFTISFVPVTGKAGDKIYLRIVSLTDPAFIPDMVNTFEYGMRHQILEDGDTITFKENTGKMPKVDDSLCVLKNVKNQRADMDKEERKRITGGDDEDLDTSVYHDIKIDGDSKQLDQKADISGKDKVHVSYIMMGHPGVKYKVHFYLNHQLLTDETGEVYELELATGKINTLDFDMDVSKITNASFYAVAVPMNAEDYPDDVINTIKNKTIHLYRGEK